MSSFPAIVLTVREKEERMREIYPSFLNPRSSVGRNSSGQEHKFIYTMKAMCGYRKHKIWLMIQEMSLGNQRFWV